MKDIKSKDIKSKDIKSKDIKDNNGATSISLIILLVYMYTLFEWLFFISKPSFMSTMVFREKTEVFFVTSFILMILILLAHLMVLSLYVFLLRKMFPSIRLYVYSIFPSFIFAALFFILTDNFTYTVLGFGVVTSSGLWRLAYAALFIILCLYALRTILYEIYHYRKAIKLWGNWIAVILIIISTTVFLKQEDYDNDSVSYFPMENLPNILLLGIDGVNADHLSVYGYYRDTTPNLRQIAKDALIVNNNFPNAGNTGGSTISILTGKLPINTRVIYPPDILMGEDAYQHLPGILRQMGYQTVQITTGHYADSYSLNLLNGFDMANFRTEEATVDFATSFNLNSNSSSYFLNLMLNRIFERIKHSFYLVTMENPYTTVIEPTAIINEQKRVDELINFLEDADNPVFAHIHMMGTHGPTFNPRVQLFSQGLEQSDPWMLEFYDDAILDFDTYVGEIIKYLKQTGKFENTIIIIYSDHGMQYTTNERLPLLIRFPYAEHKRVVNHNVQNLDIAPTILDYLTGNKPIWMEGQSIIHIDPPINRYIFSVSVSAKALINENNYFSINQNEISPPFYQLGEISVIQCHKWYKLNLVNLKFSYGEIERFLTPCKDSTLDTIDEIYSVILKHLSINGYDISSLSNEVLLSK